MTPAAPTPAPQPPRHAVALGVALGLALSAHAWLLAWAPPAPAAAADPSRRVQVRVRQIVHPDPGTEALVAAVPPSTAAPGPRVQPGATRPATQPRIASDVPDASDESKAVAEAEPASPPPASAGTGGTPLPVYSTRLAPAATLQFQLRRGALAGQATLQWQPADRSYLIKLQGQAQGTALVDWASQGEFDAAGIAPVRYSESRRGREQRAANFQRGAGKISYSGPSVEHVLVPGAQDRLSWLFQLGAVLAANPGLAEAGTQVAMLVVGTRGDAEAWAFTVTGTEPVDLPDGSVVQALHLHRAPQRPYDTHAQVWLDPARHHLPVRLQLLVHATGESTEYLLQRLDLP